MSIVRFKTHTKFKNSWSGGGVKRGILTLATVFGFNHVVNSLTQYNKVIMVFTILINLTNDGENSRNVYHHVIQEKTPGKNWKVQHYGRQNSNKGIFIQSCSK